MEGIKIGTWIKRARIFCNITARQLAEMTCLSLNYIQRIESGDRTLPDSTAKRLFDSLGFTPSEICLDSRPLKEKILAMIATADENDFCTLTHKESNGRKYYTDCIYLGSFDNIRHMTPPDNIIRLRYALSCVIEQENLYESYTTSYYI